MNNLKANTALALQPVRNNYSPNAISMSSSLGSMTTSPDSSLPLITPEYLQELLKDKRNLLNFPNVFHHLERILETEIGRARSSLYHQNGSSTSSRQQITEELPEGDGPVVTVQEKVYIPVKENPNYNFVGRLLGPRGMTAKQLETDLDCKIMVRGKGSMRDKKKEDQNRGKPNWEHLADELHVLVSVEDHQNRAEIKAKRAAEEIRVFLEQAVKMPAGDDSVKHSQLIELAMINGTFRDSTADKRLALHQQQQQQPLPQSPHGCAVPFGCQVIRMQATRASNATAALSAAAAAAAASLPLVPAGAAAQMPQFLRLPTPSSSAAAAAAAAMASMHPQQSLQFLQASQQHQQLLGIPLVQAPGADISAYLLAAAAASAGSAPANAAAAAAGAGASSSSDPNSSAAMMALMYPGMFDFSG